MTRLVEALARTCVAVIAPLSTYICRLRCDQEELTILRMGEVKMAERMGERGEPWGVLWSRGKGSERKSLKERQSLRLERNDLIHWHRGGEKPKLRKIATARSMLILSKKPKMSKRRVDATCLVATTAWALCTRHNAASVAQW